MYLRRAIVCAALAAFSSAAGAAAEIAPQPAASSAATVPALEVTRKVQSRYDETKSFTADFEQEMRVEAGGQVLRSSGKVYFLRPGRMLWSYESPEPQTILSDGDYLWVYQPEEQQILKTRLREAFQSKTPVSFLLGVARVEQDFSPTLLKPAADGSPRLRLAPRSDPGGGMGTLTLELEPVTFDIRAAIIQDPLGNTTRVALKGLRRNEPIDAGKFRFVPPAGVDVIESPTR